jgi:glycosyltransferase involved in cell wall biosynthesis
LADEILIADAGSTDGTLEIVRELPGCRLIQREWVDYANFKNWAIPQASHQWVLLVDADERLTPELSDEVRQTLSNPSPHIDAYWIGFNPYFMGHAVPHSPLNHATLRLFRRDRCRFVPRRVHELLGVPRKRTRKLRSRFEHYTIYSYDQYLDKYNRYTRWGAEEAWNRGKRAGVVRLLVRPGLRFLQLYFLRGGFLDGLAGLQVCALTAFFNTFMKQARLWEMEHARPNPESPPVQSIPRSADSKTHQEQEAA